jgi:hypothetical protein
MEITALQGTNSVLFLLNKVKFYKQRGVTDVLPVLLFCSFVLSDFQMSNVISPTEYNSGTIQKLPIWSSYYNSTQKYNRYIPQQWHLAGYVSTKKCAVIVGCICYILQVNRSNNSRRQFLSFASIAFSKRYVAATKL